MHRTQKRYTVKSGHSGRRELQVPKSITQTNEGESKGGTYKTYKNATVVITIDTDQTATANICNHRFLGIVVIGTKLKEMSKQPPTPKPKEKRDVLYVGMESNNGLGTFSGVVASLDRRSLSVEADTVFVSFSFGSVGCASRDRVSETWTWACGHQ